MGSRALVLRTRACTKKNSYTAMAQVCIVDATGNKGAAAIKTLKVK